MDYNDTVEIKIKNQVYTFTVSDLATAISQSQTKNELKKKEKKTRYIVKIKDKIYPVKELFLNLIKLKNKNFTYKDFTTQIAIRYLEAFNLNIEINEEVKERKKKNIEDNSNNSYNKIINVIKEKSNNNTTKPQIIETETELLDQEPEEIIEEAEQSADPFDIFD